MNQPFHFYKSINFINQFLSICRLNKMGRRKQANPTRLTEDIEDTGEQKVSTSSNHESQSAFGRIEENGLKNGKETDKKSCINFSISAHLQPDSRDDSKINKSSKHTNSATIDTSYQAAQKAYQTLMSNLKQQEAMMKSMASNPAAAAFFMNPFFGAGMPPFDFFSSLQAMAPKRKHKGELYPPFPLEGRKHYKFHQSAFYIQKDPRKVWACVG